MESQDPLHNDSMSCGWHWDYGLCKINNALTKQNRCRNMSKLSVYIPPGIYSFMLLSYHFDDTKSVNNFISEI